MLLVSSAEYLLKTRGAVGVSVMLWTMLFWKTLSLGIHVDISLTHATYLNIITDVSTLLDGSGILWWQGNLSAG